MVLRAVWIRYLVREAPRSIRTVIAPRYRPWGHRSEKSDFGVIRGSGFWPVFRSARWRCYDYLRRGCSGNLSHRPDFIIINLESPPTPYIDRYGMKSARKIFPQRSFLITASSSSILLERGPRPGTHTGPGPGRDWLAEFPPALLGLASGCSAKPATVEDRPRALPHRLPLLPFLIKTLRAHATRFVTVWIRSGLRRLPRLGRES